MTILGERSSKQRELLMLLEKVIYLYSALFRKEKKMITWQQRSFECLLTASPPRPRPLGF